MTAFQLIAVALVGGLWGITTLAFVLLSIAFRFQLTEARNAAIVAECLQQSAEKKYDELSAAMKQILERPAVAVFTNEQVDRLSMDIYNRVVNLQSQRMVN